MNEKEQSWSFLLLTVVISVTFLCGFLFGKGCHETEYKYLTKRDTITEIKTVPREAFVKPDIKVKNIIVPVKDTFYVSEKLPCDSAFIVQSDSVITNTGDTLNLAFWYNNEHSFFSLLQKPRPDTILQRKIEIPVVKESKNYEWSWIVTAFALGIGIGILGANK